ncbi:SpaA isopeptide-forming pilin-related protein [Pseudobutyrivibrio sp.]|uniref:SpaA isopeptide-forming pilin-related protein n=1 Tax=Pseudobutyrivibrio sp. TaxID=2014367 RepID=UPI001B683279|nr:SpaA isopeptide-forming pilin-related protein [Pseudobutyrivibrio sp.]MBP3262040.1 fibro-slime domain-containing protein [Pseudobutyrivibrio sp.]
MKRNSMFNRMISFGLALALFVSSPVSVFAGEDTSASSVETITDNNIEAKEADAEDNLAETEDIVDEEVESKDEEIEHASEAIDSNDLDDSADTNSARAGVFDIKLAEEENKAEDESFEEEYTYSSNNNGTHVKSWIDEEGNEHSEEENCNYDEEGICVNCGYTMEEISLEYSDEEVTVTVTALKSILGKATSVRVEKVVEGDNYEEIEDALSINANENGKDLIAFLAYDIKLTDDDGNEVEPEEGNVSVQICSLAVPDNKSELEGSYPGIVHFAENENAEKALIDLTDDESTIIEIGNDISNVDATFETDSFSTYAVTWTTPSISEANKVGTITWSRNGDGKKDQRYAEIYIVDESGKAITSISDSVDYNLDFDKKTSLDKLEINPVGDDYLAAIANSITVNDYNYVAASLVSTKTKMEKIDGITNLKRETKAGDWQYQKASNNKYISTNNYDVRISIILTYTKKNEPTFKADLFQYNDDAVAWPVTVTNYLAFKNAQESGKDKYLELNSGGLGIDEDAYWQYYNKYEDQSKLRTNYEKNNWNRMHYTGVYQGLADKTLDANGMIQFSQYGTPGFFTSDSYDSSRDDFYTDIDYISFKEDWGDVRNWTKKAYYNLKFPFKLDSDGYYEFDSKKQTATYDEKSDYINVVDGAGNFTPMGKFHFGMHFSTDFYMTSDGKYNGKDCIFEFSGDDDVWVFVDDELVLDLGGIHSPLGGSINFATGKVEVDNVWNGTEDNSWTNQVGDSQTTLLDKKYLDNGLHKLQVYYLERGQQVSNCKIRFNLPIVDKVGEPIDVSFTKRDGMTDQHPVISGAKFELRDNKNNLVGEATSDTEGLVRFSSVPVGTYKLIETVAPTGYLNAGHTWTVNIYAIDGVTKYTIKDSTSTGDVVSDANGYSIYNYKGGSTTVVDYGKVAEVSDRNGKRAGWTDREYKITLTADAYEKSFEDEVVINSSDIVLVIDATYSMYFPSDLVEDNNVSQLIPGREYYIIHSDQGATVYRVYYDESIARWRISDASKHTEDGEELGSGSDGFLDETIGYDGKYKYEYWFQLSNAKSPTKYEVSKFYYSPSGGKDTRLKELQEQTSYFIKELNALCPGRCNLGIVYFNSDHFDQYGNRIHDGKGTLVDLQALNNDTVDTFLNAINGSRKTQGTLESKLYAGTNQSLGIEQAYTMLGGDYDYTHWDDGNKKYVIMATDGCPTVDSSMYYDNKPEIIHSNYSTSTRVTNFKNKMLAKDSNLSIMTIGIDLERASSTTQSKANGVLKATVTNSNYIFTTAQKTLEEVYDGIIEIIVNGKIKKTPKTGAVVTDVIDQRFELITDGMDYGTTDIVKNSDGTTTIKWSNITTDDWKQMIYVRAKDDFMGGNVVTTNTNESGLTIDNNIFYKFEEPTVNVRLLPITAQGDEITILLDSLFSPEQLERELINYFGNNVKFKITNDVIKTLLEGQNTEFIPYSYGTTGDNVGAFKLKLTPINGTPIGNNAIAEELGHHVYEYKLNVIYNAYYYSTRANKVLVNRPNIKAPIQPDIDAGYILNNSADELFTLKKQVEASYFVNVVDLGVYISKIGGSTKSLLNGASYQLYKDEACKIALFDKPVISSELMGENGQMFFKGIGVGTYYLKEVIAPKGYSLSTEVIKINVTQDMQLMGKYRLSFETNGDSKDYLSKPIEFDVTNYNWISPYSDTTYILKGIETSVFDTVAYTLPETGGRGIYVYTIGGILLMIAGALLLYKNKYKK